MSGHVGGIQRLLAGGFGRWSGATLLFSVAAVVQTWPLVLHAADSIVVWEDNFVFDSWFSLWSLWWVKHALVELHTNPFHTDLLFFPQGTDLYFALSFTNGVLSIPLQLATGNLVLSWNVLALLFFVLSGLGMYALSYRVTRNHAAALVSGYIFAFSPFILMRFAGHWGISTTWPIPLFVLFLLRFQETGRLREAVAAGIFWSVLTYNGLEYGAWAGGFLGLFLAYWSVVYLRRKDWIGVPALWRGSVLAAGVWLAVTAPLVVPIFLSVGSGDYFVIGGDEYYSTDLLAFVTPSPLWGPGTAPVNSPPFAPHVPAGSIENTTYLGIVPLILAGLAILAIRRSPHRVVFWAMVFLFFATLALGPYLYVGNTKSLSLLGASFTVPLPYQIYDQLPVLAVGRAPARMIAFALVGLAVLAGIGFNLLTSWLRAKRKVLIRVAALLILGLVVLEYWNPPVFLYEPPAPAVVKAIGDEPGDFAVLTVPWGRVTSAPWAGDYAGGYTANYYQTLHGKAALGGMIPRARQSDIDWVWQQPGLRFLACAQCPEFTTEEDRNPDLVRQLFQEYRIKYVVVRSAFYGFEAYDEYLQTMVGLTPISSDSTLTVYRNQEIE